MANMLDGIQYRIPKTVYVNTFRNWDESDWQEWVDCGDKILFTGRAQFRVKPVIEYTVTQLGTATTTSKHVSVMTNRDTAMAKVATLMDQGYEVAIIRKEKPLQTVAELLAARNVQHRINNQDWRNGSHFSDSISNGNTVRFRLRPDEFWKVNITLGISSSEITFEDSEDLAKYLAKYATTNNSSRLSVTPVRYV